MPEELSPEEMLRRLLEEVGAEKAHQIVAELDHSAAAQSGGGHAAAASGDRNVAQAAETIINLNHFATAKIGDDEAHALADYLDDLRTECQGIPLLGINPDEANAESRGRQPELQQVYVGLNVIEPRPADDDEKDEMWAREEKQGRGMPRKESTWSAVEACAEYQQAVLLGDPGSGKSTFLRMLSAKLAQEFYRAGGEGDPEPVFPDRLIPIFVVLRDFAAADLGDAKPKVRLPRFVEQQLEQDNLAEAFPVLKRLWSDGKAILMLDGLDEIATSDRRDYVLDSIRQFANQYKAKGTRILVTCRVAAYRHLGLTGGSPDQPGADWRLPETEFPTLTLAPFNRQQMHQFIDRWYAELKQKGRMSGDPVLKAGRLRRALERSHIRRLAPNPLLLTVMTIVHANIGELPDQRVKLYQEAVETLLHRWRQGRDPGEAKDEPESVMAILAEEDETTTGLLSRLWRLARDVHAKTPAGSESKDRAEDEGVADIGFGELVAGLHDLHSTPDNSRPWTSRLIEAIKHRSGLLVEIRRDVFAFPHRTFQEFLAARELARDQSFTQTAFDLRLGSNALWREVILMAAGTYAHIHNDSARAFPLIQRLLEAASVSPNEQGSQGDLILAADLIAEMTTKSVRDAIGGDELVALVQGRLQAAMFAPALDAEARSTIGSALGRVTDPRAGVATASSRGSGDARYPNLEWSSPIPPDPFRMGNSKKQSKSNNDETPRFSCDLIEANYAISIYAVTVAQYQLFIDDHGYQSDCDQFWTGEGLEWRNGGEITGPETYRDIFQTPNHPQVGVSWYEAVAFCNWLSERSGMSVRLPTEPEWERAARHSDARVYPWGDEDPSERANIHLTGIGTTSPVGLFEGGQAECGAFDLSGNVFEWCQSKWTNDYVSYGTNYDASPDGSELRVLRGGAWYFNSDYARCAYRSWDHPAYRYNHLGFRLCVSPFSSSGL